MSEKSSNQPVKFPEDFMNCSLKFSEFRKYATNPFMEQLVKSSLIASNTHPIPKQLMADGVLDKDTGEVIDVEKVYAYAEGITYTDTRKFIKLFDVHLAQIGRLSAEELRVMIYIFQHLRYEGIVFLHPQYISEYLHYKNRRSAENGLLGLLQKGFIAKSSKIPHEYFINPLVFFKGNIEAYYANFMKKSADKKSVDQIYKSEEDDNF